MILIDRLEVTPGRGTVLRFGAIVAWAAPDASPALVGFLSQSAQNLAPAPSGGSQLADHIAAVLAAGDPEPGVAFAVAGPAGKRGVGLLLHGPVQAWEGTRWLTPERPDGWLRCDLFPRGGITVGAAGAAAPLLGPDSIMDLRSGVVPGRGFVALLSDAPTDSGPLVAAPVIEHADPTISLPTVAPTVDPTVAIPVATEAGQHETEADGSAGAGPAATVDLRTVRSRLPGRPAVGTPLPVGDRPDRAVPGSTMVAGVVCPRGHVNRPGTNPCVKCSTPMPTALTVRAARPPLGVLVVDDGTVFRLDKPYVVGSDPAGDPSVRRGAARGLRLAGGEVAVSHAAIRFRGWNVMVADRDAPSGTWVCAPGEVEWRRLRSGESRRLVPGTHIAFGRRIVTYLTPWVAGPG